MRGIWRHQKPFTILQILLGLNPFKITFFFIKVTLLSVVQMSTFICKLSSNSRDMNYVGSSMNPNANFLYMWKTFDRADYGAMYTNQAMEMTEALRDTNKPQTPLQNVTIYLSTGFASTWWKAKSNITCARRYGKLQPMRPDIPRAMSAMKQ